MMDAFIERENEIFDILHSFEAAGLPFVLIGGYAVSAYMHRFSVDADVCMDRKDFGNFQSILHQKQFVLEKRRDLEDVYSGFIACYKKKTKLPVTVDIMAGSVVSRNTNASFCFETLLKNSAAKKIVGIEKEVHIRIPAKELLIALKIHSARLTDARDIVALCHHIDFGAVAKFVHRGDRKEVQKNIGLLLSFFNNPDFADSFKGVFSIERLPSDSLKNAIRLMEELRQDYAGVGVGR
ncbi:hypothetical protein HYV84_01020 [Candidatus Woesearchaeota archaeon]|nr:hypothetical protein [Candidatus Woesearchaeota archaeon]